MLIRNFSTRKLGGQAADEAIFSVTCPHKPEETSSWLRITPPLLPFAFRLWPPP
jgi:hypothetical protein